MRITVEEARRRLASQENLAHFAGNRVTHTEKADKHVGTRDGVPNVPPFLRNIIGDVARAAAWGPSEFRETQDEIGEAFGVSQDVVSSCKLGKPNGHVQPSTTALERIAAQKNNIKDVALNKLMMSLGLMDKTKMTDLDAKGLSVVAKNVSSVVGNLEDKHVETGDRTNIVIYAPRVGDESKYRVIDV